MYTPTKVCPTCEGEFRMHVERCPDCGSTLEATEPSSGRGSAAAPERDRDQIPRGYALGPDDLPQGDSLDTLAALGIAGEPSGVREVSVLLSRERIRHWLIPRDVKDPLAAYNKPEDYMDLFVPADELDRASAVVRRHLWSDLPEGLEIDTALEDERTCPACSSPLPAGGIEECPECGLAVGG